MRTEIDNRDVRELTYAFKFHTKHVGKNACNVEKCFLKNPNSDVVNEVVLYSFRLCISSKEII